MLAQSIISLSTQVFPLIQGDHFFYNNIRATLSPYPWVYSYPKEPSNKFLFTAMTSSNENEGFDYMKQGLVHGTSDISMFHEELQSHNRQGLKKYLMKYGSEFISERKVAIVGCGSVIKSIAELNPFRIVHYTESLDTNANSLCNIEMKVPPPSPEATQISFEENHDLCVETRSFDDLACFDDNDTIILATTSQAIIDDPFVNDFLRHTSSLILMDTAVVDEFCYHARIQEGADIKLW